MAKKKEAKCPIKFDGLKQAEANKKIIELGYMKISKDLIKQYVKAYDAADFEWIKDAYVYKDKKQKVAATDAAGNVIYKVEKDGKTRAITTTISTGEKSKEKTLSMQELKKMFCKRYGLDQILPKTNAKNSFDDMFDKEWA